MNRDVPLRLFIHATNVHHGGGRSILYALLGALPEKLELIALLDTRMDVPECMPESMQIKRVRPSILQRLKAEWWLARNVRSGDAVLCFGNLPPLFRLCGRVSVFAQNRYLVDKINLTGFPLNTRLRISIERLWFGWFASHVDEFIVQTPSMKSLLEPRLGNNPAIHVMPLVSSIHGYCRTILRLCPGNDHIYDFLYVATGEPHKNHTRLVEAWSVLATDELFPSLCLTIDETYSAELYSWIENMKTRFGLNIVNRGMISHDQVKELYSQARALIYPSTLESFGLPLIEARQAGLPILASELDYVRDIIDPEETFNPDSALSIARAVKRFMKIAEKPLPLMTGSEFIKQITERI